MKLADINQYAQWVESITFDTVENLWILKAHPGVIVKGDFCFISRQLAAHVHAEVVQLICDALKIDYKLLFTKKRNSKIVHTRWAAALVLKRRFKSSLQLISSSVGYTTHVAMYNGLARATECSEAKERVQKVYRVYPWLYRRSESIK